MHAKHIIITTFFPDYFIKHETEENIHFYYSVLFSILTKYLKQDPKFKNKLFFNNELNVGYNAENKNG